MDHTDATADATDYSQKLFTSSTGRIGVAKLYKVYPGDKVKIEAYAKYYNLTSTGTSLAGFATSLLSAFNLPVPAPGETGTSSSALNTWGGYVEGGNSHGTSGYPMAFVNLIVLDKNNNFLDAAWNQIDGGAQSGIVTKAAHDYMTQEYTAKEEGWIYVYTSNENATSVEVYFDDVVITRTKSNVIQYNEYYPFGLQTASSWTRENTTDNQYLYNAANELNDNTGWYEMFYRGYDPAIGRMLQVDPYATMYASLSAYNYGANNPAMFNDPTGAVLQTPPDWEQCFYHPVNSGLIDYHTGGGGGGHYRSDRPLNAGTAGWGGSRNTGTYGNIGSGTTSITIGEGENAITIEVDWGQVTGEGVTFGFDNGVLNMTGTVRGIQSSGGNNTIFFGGYYAPGGDGVEINGVNGHMGYIMVDDLKEPLVLLDKNGDVKSWDKGANNIFVDLGDGRVEKFRDQLAMKGDMKPEAFSKGLLSVVDGMKLPEGTFDSKRLYKTGAIAISLINGVKAYTDLEYVRGKAAYTLSSRQGLPEGMMTMVYQGIGSNLTVDRLRSILGYHEFYAHGIKLLSHPIDNAEITRIENSYFKK